VTVQPPSKKTYQTCKDKIFHHNHNRNHNHHHCHHHHELWSVRFSAYSLNVKVKLALPSFSRASYASLRLWFIQGDSRLVDIIAGGDFLDLCDQKSSYKHVSDFGRLRSYGHFLIPVHALL
jgi:hypothetical protein